MSITETEEAHSHSQAGEAENSAVASTKLKSESRMFRGVRKRSWGRYVSEIRLPGQKTRIWLGSFASPEMAARAYDSAAFFLKGASAYLNFPELVHSLPRPLSSSRRDIQSAAAKAAALRLPCSSSKTEHHESMEKKMEECWWDELGQHDPTTSSFHDAPLMSPLSTFGDFTWNDLVFNFNDDYDGILTSTLF